MVKWIFFDVGSTLVDETEAYDHRVREMIVGTSITFKEFDDVRIALARQGLDGNSAAIKHFGLTKTRGTRKMKFRIQMHIAHWHLSLSRDISLALSQTKNSERQNAWSLGACANTSR